MTASELMIGDWVYMDEITKFPMQVVYVGKDDTYLDFEENEGDVFEIPTKDIKPIELTDEFFEINEWEPSSFQHDNVTYYIGYSYTTPNEKIHIDYRTDKKTLAIWSNYRNDKGCYADHLISDVCYVHQLQNALRIGGASSIANKLKIRNDND